MPRITFDLTLGVEFVNSVADNEDTLDEEMKDVQAVVKTAIENRISKSFRGSVRVWVQRAAMDDA